MEHLVVPVDSLTPDPKNARRHSQRNLEAIDKSLDSFGQVKPIVVWHDTVIAGNGFLSVAKQRGMTEVAVVRVPDEWTEAKARAYAVADNRTAELAEWDADILVEVYDSLSGDGLLDSLGFDDDDILTFRDLATDGESSDFIAAHDDSNPDESDEPAALLSIADVTVAEPKHQVERGDTWVLTMPNGTTHTLLIVNPITEWAAFTPHLGDNSLLLCFPDPYITATEGARERNFVFVQPDSYLAGHLLDKHTSFYGEDSVQRG